MNQRDTMSHPSDDRGEASSLLRQNDDPIHSDHKDDLDEKDEKNNEDHDANKPKASPFAGIKIGLRVKKCFGGMAHYGVVVGGPQPVNGTWRVRYDDGNHEDLSTYEIEYLVLGKDMANVRKMGIAVSASC